MQGLLGGWNRLPVLARLVEAVGIGSQLCGLVKLLFLLGMSCFCTGFAGAAGSAAQIAMTMLAVTTAAPTAQTPNLR